MSFKNLQNKLHIPATGLHMFEHMWLLAPIAVWFSYRPLIRFGKDSAMYYELSITMLYVLILALIGVPLLWQNSKVLQKNLAVRIVSVFLVISAVSILWSANVTRGVFTLGVIGILYIIFLASVARQKEIGRIIPALSSIFIVSAIAMSILSFIQVIAGIWLSKEQALLCNGCVASQFGFARSTLFTIEPQFLGNILLVPAFLALYRLLTKKHDNFTLFGFFIITSALFLTLSRGAIFAFFVGLPFMFISLQPSVAKIVRTLAIMSASFLFCIIFQGIIASLNPTINTSFFKATSTSINQLSLGVINIPVQQTTQPSIEAPEQKNTIKSEVITQNKNEKDPNFDGYVAESTNVRLKLTKLAVQSWSASPERILVGVGLGGSGVTLRNDFPSQVNQLEIVQNEFMEVLLENGIVGMAVYISILAGLFYTLRKHTWTWAIIVAFIVQWNFFSGHPNALHIYLIFIVLFMYSLQTGNKKEKN